MFEPLGEMVLTKEPEDTERVTAGGILIPEAVRSDVTTKIVTVVAVGPGERHPRTGEYIPVDLEEGDDVVVPPFGGRNISFEGEDYLLFRASDILGVVR